MGRVCRVRPSQVVTLVTVHARALVSPLLCCGQAARSTVSAALGAGTGSASSGHAAQQELPLPPGWTQLVSQSLLFVAGSGDRRVHGSYGSSWFPSGVGANVWRSVLVLGGIHGSAVAEGTRS